MWKHSCLISSSKRIFFSWVNYLREKKKKRIKVHPRPLVKLFVFFFLCLFVFSFASLCLLSLKPFFTAAILPSVPRILMFQLTQKKNLQILLSHLRARFKGSVTQHGSWISEISSLKFSPIYTENLPSHSFFCFVVGMLPDQSASFQHPESFSFFLAV